MALQTIHRIGPMSLAKVMGVLYAFIGLVFGGLISLFSLIGALGAAIGQDSGAFGLLFGVGAVVIAPLFYGAMGFIGGLVMALIYNLVARMIGGIEMEIS